MVEVTSYDDVGLAEAWDGSNSSLQRRVVRRVAGVDIDVNDNDVGDLGGHQFKGCTDHFVDRLDNRCRGQRARRAGGKVRVGKDKEAFAAVRGCNGRARGGQSPVSRNVEVVDPAAAVSSRE